LQISESLGSELLVWIGLNRDGRRAVYRSLLVRAGLRRLRVRLQLGTFRIADIDLSLIGKGETGLGLGPSAG